jgi:hypothetical protein
VKAGVVVAVVRGLKAVVAKVGVVAATGVATVGAMHAAVQVDVVRVTAGPMVQRTWTWRNLLPIHCIWITRRTWW